MNPNPTKLYVTECELSEILVHLTGFGYYPEYNEPPFLFTATVRKMSWEDFQRRLAEWNFHVRLGCTFISQNEIYITEVTFTYDTDRVRELERGEAVDIEELGVLETPYYYGLPELVYCHLIGQLKTKLTPN